VERFPVSITEEVIGAEADIENLDRVLTIPNALTLARLGLLGWALALLFGSNARVEAAVVLAIAGSTDFFDGYIARRFHQISNLGKFFDPIVDVVVLMSAVIAVAVYGGAPWWLAGIILARETHMVVTGLVLKKIGARRIDVIFLGKCATFGLMATFPALLLGDGAGLAARVLRIVGWVIGYPSLALSIVTVFLYIPIARAAIAGGVADRTAAAEENRLTLDGVEMRDDHASSNRSSRVGESEVETR
jgi:cardiolipin synthase